MSPLFAAVGFLLLIAVAPAPAFAASDPRATQVVNAFHQAYASIRTYQGRIRSESRMGKKVEITRSKLWLEKPHGTCFEILEAPMIPHSVGTKLIWYGEDTCQVKTRFFGFAVKLTPAFDDSRLSGIRGWNLREVGMANVVRLLKDAKTEFKFVGSDRLMDRPMTVVEARGPLVLRGTDRQVFWFDDALRMPFAIEAWDGGERAFRVEIEAFKFNAPMPAGVFRLD